MSYKNDLLMATLHANHMQKGDFTGKGYREELQECAAKAPGSGGSGGGADLSALLETTYTDTLTWDGDLTGRETVVLVEDEEETVCFVRVGDAILPYGDVHSIEARAVITDPTGGTMEMTSSVGVSDTFFIFNFGNFQAGIVYADQVIETGETMKPGVYFMHAHDANAGSMYISKLTWFPVFAAQTIKPELLPETGGVFVATISGKSDDGENVTWSVDKTFAEIVDALNAGMVVSANVRISFGENTIFATNGSVFGMTVDNEGSVNINFYAIDTAQPDAVAVFAQFSLTHSDVLTCVYLSQD